MFKRPYSSSQSKIQEMRTSTLHHWSLVTPYHSSILLDLNLLTQVMPGISSSPATRIVVVTWLTYSSPPVATSANSSGNKADATYLCSVWRTPWPACLVGEKKT